MAKALVTFFAILFAISSSDVPQEEKKIPTRADLDSFVKVWSDARFWILTNGRRTGWQRYQVRWGEYAGEKMLEVEFERATYLFSSERFTAWLRPDATLSPRAVRWGKSRYMLEVDKGKIDLQSPFGERDPGNLSIFPFFLTSFIPLKENSELAFNYLHPRVRKSARGQMKTLALETPPETVKGRSAWKITLSTKVPSLDDPETGETTLWLNPDRTLIRAQTKISYTLSNGEQQKVPEVLVPADAKEWDEGSLVSNEMWAHAELRLLADLSTIFRAHDADENFANDYWTGDVSGLHRIIPPKRKEPISLISKEVALADGAPLPAGPEKGGGTLDALIGPKPIPWHGYFFRVLSKGSEEGKAILLNDGSNRYPSMFGFCAYPAEYGKTGRKTFLITESLESFWKDLKGQPVAETPSDLNKEGWQWDGPSR